MPIHDIQSSFSGGEFSPKLFQRIDIQKWKSGLRTLRNFLVSPLGPIYNRPGTYFVSETKYNDKKSRLIPFIFSREQSYVLEFSEGKIRFFQNGGYVSSNRGEWSSSTAYAHGDTVTASGNLYFAISASTNKDPVTEPTYWTLWDGNDEYYEVSTTYIESELFELKYTQSADTLYITHPDHEPATLKRYGQQNWVLSDFAFKNGPFMPSNTDEEVRLVLSVSNPMYLIASNKAGSDVPGTFTAANVGSLYKLTHDIESSSLNSSLSTVSATGSIQCGGDWKLVISDSSGTFTINLEKSTDNGTTWEIVGTFTDVMGSVNTYGSIDNGGDPFLIRLNCTAISGSSVNYTLTRDPFIVQSVVQASSWPGGDGHSILCTKVSESPIRGKYTADWAEGSWSSRRGWPACVTFFQDRLAMASSETEPGTVWISKTANYVDFGTSIPLVDSDAISVNIQDRQVNTIKSILSFNNYIMGFTSVGEWSIGSTNGGPVTPSTVFTKNHGQRGSSGVDPIVAGNQCIYISPASSSIRNLIFQFSSDTFSGDNISLMSAHLFEGYSITSMAYQQEPDSQIWMVRDDGALIALTYVPEQEVYAFSRHDTDGEYEDVCVIPGEESDEVWFSVLRDSVRTIERMKIRTVSLDTDDQYFVDCGLTYSGSPASSVSGLDHLEGKTVSILADGYVIKNKTVVGGAVSLGASYSKIHVGLKYISDVETIGFDMPQQNGTMQGRKYHIARVVFYFINSRGGFCGMDEDNLKAIIQKTTSGDLSQHETLQTGFSRQNLKQNYDSYGHVMYRQTDPLPVTIASILPIIDPGEK
ncbi:MAG: hypothetical protein IPP74_13485 [Alphaproteobacteria bacterium]|nr:hypothetical protein [Alphaproteobacteria bacterium]